MLKGVRNPGNIKMWINPLGPGQYPSTDGLEQPSRVHLASSPAWTQRKGQPAETIRASKAANCAPGPGYYAPETKAEKPGRHRICQNAGQFSLIFSRLQTGSTPGSILRSRSEAASQCGLIQEMANPKQSCSDFFSLDFRMFQIDFSLDFKAEAALEQTSQMNAWQR